MPNILRQLPYSTEPSQVSVGDEQVRIKPHQIIVWISLNLQGLLDVGEAPRIPAILDTGHTHNLSIQERHLIEWAGLRREYLRVLGNIRERGRSIPLLDANVWIHRNRSGQRDEVSDRPAFQLDLPDGIAVYPADGTHFPRLPLLGLRAITENDLRLTIDGRRREVSLATSRLLWPF